MPEPGDFIPKEWTFKMLKEELGYQEIRFKNSTVK